MKRIEVLGLQTIPEIQHEDDLAQIIVACANDEIGGLQDKDIMVLTSKIVSKAMGRMRNLDEVVAGKKACDISKRTGKDARWLQMIFDEGHEIVAIIPLEGLLGEHILSTSTDSNQSRELVEHEQALCITRGKAGRTHPCDAGIAGSNHPAGGVSLRPEDPDETARVIRQEFRRLTGKEVAVILADTEMIPFGTMDFAVGSSGIPPVSKMFGHKDLFGTPKFGGMDLVANELTSASALVFGQTGAGIPAAIIRGCDYEVSETANIGNTLLPHNNNGGAVDALRATMRATASAKGLKQRMLLTVGSWFV